MRSARQRLPRSRQRPKQKKPSAWQLRRLSDRRAWSGSVLWYHCRLDASHVHVLMYVWMCRYRDRIHAAASRRVKRAAAKKPAPQESEDDRRRRKDPYAGVDEFASKYF